MKKVILSMALALAAPLAWAQVSETTTTTTTTEGNGTITEFTPGSTIVLKETAGPKHYRFGKKVVYVTRSGKELDEATVRTRGKVGVPVRVQYMGEGDDIMVDPLSLDEDEDRLGNRARLTAPLDGAVGAFSFFGRGPLLTAIFCFAA